MPTFTTSTSLEMPPAKGLSQEALAALNERFLVISSLLGNGAAVSPPSAQASARPTATVSSGGEVVLSVPGTLGIQTNAAPLVSLRAAVTPVSLVALLKQAPQGAPVTIQVCVGGANWATLAIANGAVSATSPAGLGAIAAGALVTLNITTVGTVFPGSDLSVLVQW